MLPGSAPQATGTILNGGRPVDESTLSSGTARLFRRLDDSGSLVDVEPTGRRHHLTGFCVWFSQQVAVGGGGSATELEVQINRRTPSGAGFTILETIYKQAFVLPASNFVPFCTGWVSYFAYGGFTSGVGNPLSVTYTLDGTAGAIEFDVGALVTILET